MKLRAALRCRIEPLNQSLSDPSLLPSIGRYLLVEIVVRIVDGKVRTTRLEQRAEFVERANLVRRPKRPQIEWSETHISCFPAPWQRTRYRSGSNGPQPFMPKPCRYRRVARTSALASSSTSKKGTPFLAARFSHSSRTGSDLTGE